MISIVIIIGTGNYIRTTMCYESVARDMKKDAQYQIDMIKDIPKEDSFIFYNGLPLYMPPKIYVLTIHIGYAKIGL